MPKYTPDPDLQPELISEERTNYSTEEKAEKERYREKLRAYLHDPEFRAIPGFPLGEDDAILELSDPPYYTACPNPFLPEIIEQWQEERQEIRKEMGLPDDTDGMGQKTYHREPFATDVSEGKSDPVYRGHSYHTKVPHKAIMRYILHYTDPGDIILDGFCGTGMTGVATQLCNDKKAVEELGYKVTRSGAVVDVRNQVISQLGIRRAILIDLSPAATYIAYNYNSPIDKRHFEREAKRIFRSVESEYGWMYETWHPHHSDSAKIKGKINYTVWSDVFVCSECGKEIIFWTDGVDHKAGKVKKIIICPECGSEHSKNSLERAWETKYIREIDETLQLAKQVPVLLNYSIGTKTHTKELDQFDLELLQKIEEQLISTWYPISKLPDGYNTRQPKESHGISYVHLFYYRRALVWLSSLMNHTKGNLTFRWPIFSLVNTVSKLYRYVPKKPGYKGQGGGVLTGTLYIPSLIRALSVPSSFKRSINSIGRAFRILYSAKGLTNNIVETRSATKSDIEANTVDYIFVDPPFGSNLMYSEINFLWESWLRVLTNNEPEAIMNKVQRKELAQYQDLMEQAYNEFYRVLKSGRWMTVEFHNSKNAIWNAIQEAIIGAGFMVADVRTLDKKQGTLKQITSTTAVKQDLIISAYKPQADFVRRFQTEGGSLEGAWDFIRQHLEQLPTPDIDESGTIESLAERQAFLLYDRMVAFHIQRGLTVPLSAPEFYQGLRQRFLERDDMYFTAQQAAEYDKRRLQAERVEQLALFVNDEQSARQWIRRQLNPETGDGPQTYQDLQPKFLKELRKARHEELPELLNILDEGFLKDSQGRWYNPDPDHQTDLEALRQKGLLREFNEYRKSRGRLRTFRSEAIRAGFSHAWQERDYEAILLVADRLPASFLEDEQQLTMYVNNARLLHDREPKQPPLL